VLAREGGRWRLHRQAERLEIPTVHSERGAG
jgi:hypothetical protein